MMGLDEAIRHSLDVAINDCTECGREHEQLDQWLMELRDIRKFMAPLRNVNIHNLYIEELKKIVKQ